MNGNLQDFGNHYTSVSGDTVFYLKNDQFYVLYNFGANIGDQWIIAENGIKCDQLQVKGLDVVRSSFPQSFKVFMKQTLIDILKGDGKEIITERILTFKTSLP